MTTVKVVSVFAFCTVFFIFLQPSTVIWNICLRYAVRTFVIEIITINTDIRFRISTVTFPHFNIRFRGYTLVGTARVIILRFADSFWPISILTPLTSGKCCLFIFPFIFALPASLDYTVRKFMSTSHGTQGTGVTSVLFRTFTGINVQPLILCTLYARIFFISSVVSVHLAAPNCFSSYCFTMTINEISSLFITQRPT